MNKEELVEKLKDWLQNSPIEGNKTSTLVAFGIKYGAALEDCGTTSKEILQSAGEKIKNAAYIDRGKNICKAIKSGSFDITFNNNLGSQAPVYKTNIQTRFSRNRIVFGAPGTGKSFMINEDRKKLLGAGNESDYERVTFHPDYSYAGFVGTYKPVMVNQSVNKEENFVVETLKRNDLTAQEKYDELYPIFKESNSITALQPLLAIYTDEEFTAKRTDGTDQSDNNNVYNMNLGRKIKKYVDLKNPSESGNISYQFVPGPFTRLLVKAYKNIQDATNPDGTINNTKIKPFVLIIEEINRAKTAAVFGDIFQLLDRDSDGVSEYPIQASEDLRKYLAKELGGNPKDYNEIRIPNNMFIWATMNSADQGVYPLDTAFKRRWDFEYIGIDDEEEQMLTRYGHNKYATQWNALRKAINAKLSSDEIKVNEDKLMGPFFIKLDNINNDDGYKALICDKVLMYLFEDAAKTKRQTLFSGINDNINRFSHICVEYQNRGVAIFGDDVS